MGNVLPIRVKPTVKFEDLEKVDPPAYALSVSDWRAGIRVITIEELNDIQKSDKL